MSIEPALIGTYFEDLCRIPRGSGNEAGVQDYLRAFAATHGFARREDAAGNIVLYVPGRGTTASPPCCIQAHMDMVCKSDPEVAHDFLEDPIRTRIERREENGGQKDVLIATGTTLGADNGFGLAAALAVATDPAITLCPPLELLCTVSEETGLTGASNLDPELIQSDLLLNLDTEELGEICISSAGGRDMIAQWSLSRSAPDPNTIPIRAYLNGLPGGHSGVQIHEARGNAIQLLRAEVRSVTGSGIRLASFTGGTARNVIAGDAELVLWMTPAQVAVLEARLNGTEWLARLRAVLLPSDKQITGGIERLAPEATLLPLTQAQTDAILVTIAAIPHGVQVWSPSVEGLVETSNNVATVTTTEDRLTLCCSTRSSQNGAIERFQSEQEERLTRSGAAVTFSDGYPGWPAEPDSPLLKQAVQSFQGVLGHAPKLTAVHAGLECGVLKGKLPRLQIISFGPDIRDAHTTQERIYLDSVPPFYACLTNLLADLARNT